MLRRKAAAILYAMATAGVLALPVAAQQKAEQGAAKQPPTAEQAAQAMQKLAQFRHAPLTVEKAKAALEVFLKLKKEYPPETFEMKTPGPMGAVEAMKASRKAQEILALVKDNGFADIDDWARTFTSLGMALAHVRQGGDEAIRARMKKLDEAPMSDDMKAKIRAMLQALVPPAENVRVAEQLLKDPEAKKMIEAVEAAR